MCRPLKCKYHDVIVFLPFLQPGRFKKIRENNILRFDIQAKVCVSQAAALMYFLKKSIFEAISLLPCRFF